jgi:hypothetical protein
MRWAGDGNLEIDNSPFLKLHIRMQVHLSCLGRFVAKPKGDHAQINSPAEQSHGCSMTQGMWCDLLSPQRRTSSAGTGDVFRDEALECISTEA